MFLQHLETQTKNDFKKKHLTEVNNISLKKIHREK